MTAKVISVKSHKQPIWAKKGGILILSATPYFFYIILSTTITSSGISAKYSFGMAMAPFH